jgi:MFS family permease
MIAICKVVCGYVCDKTGRRAVYLLIAMVGAGLGLYFTVTCRDNLTAMVILTMGCGLIGFATPATFTLLQDVVPRKAISAGAGVLSGVGNGVAALAPVTVGYIISLTGDYGSGLLYLGALTVVGAVMALILMKVGR